MTELADAAFRQAAWKVIARAEATGTPVIVCERGAVVELTPAEARRRLERSRRKRGRRR